MHKQLHLLRDLQELDIEKKAVEREQQTGLDEQNGLKSEISGLQSMVDSLANDIGVLEDEKSELNNAMTLEQENISRSENRLPQIKTQKEYIAVLKEIDTAKKLAKELQSQIDAKDEVLTTLNIEKTEKDEALEKAQEEANARSAEIETSLKKVKEKLDEMDRQRNSLLEHLPTRLRKRYELLMSRRGGVAVVEARNGACLGCHMHLPPQLFNSLFVVEEIQTCPHCNRLLFVTAPD